MGIMTKPKETMTANLNALFNRAEDPEEIKRMQEKAAAHPQTA